MIPLDQLGAPAFISARQPDGRFVYEQMNQAAARLTGLDPARVAGQTVRETFGDALASKLEASYGECLDRQAVIDSDGTIVALRPDVVTRTTLTPIFDEAGTPAHRLLGMMQDITAQFRSQQELRRSEARLSIALDALKGASWYFDVEHRQFELSPAFDRILGPGTAPTMMLDEWIAHVHPDDRDDTCFAAILAGELDEGSNSFRVFSSGGDVRWLACRRRAFVEDAKVVGIIGVVVDVTAERSREAALSVQATTDPLTGLANRRGLEEALASQREQAVEHQTPFTILMIDVDLFKNYNDIYGHVAGDIALRRVAACLEAATANRRATAARFGGEEFVLVLPGVDLDEAAQIAHSILSDIRSMNQPHGGAPSGRLSVSIGIGHHPRLNRHSKTDLVALADAALYRAKSEGRDRYCMRSVPHRGSIVDMDFVA